MIAAAAVAMLLFLIGAIMTYRQRGWTWVSVVLAGGALFGVAGIIEAAVFRVQLTDDALVITDLRGHRRFPKSDITGVEEGKGMPTYIILTSGRGVALPPVGSSMGNSIRAWIKHTG